MVGRKKLDDWRYLPYEIGKIYSETHSALCSGLLILGGIGMGVLVEAVCKEMDASGNTLKKKITNLVDKGVLTGNKVDLLCGIVDLRNRAAHEVKPLTRKQVDEALDVVEHLLMDVYILPKTIVNLPRKKQANIF
jgi:hypothetical protein